VNQSIQDPAISTLDHQKSGTDTDINRGRAGGVGSVFPAARATSVSIRGMTPSDAAPGASELIGSISTAINPIQQST
jgi:hypothetical protein